MTDLTSKGWIVAKGTLFAIIGALSAALILAELPSLRIGLLLIVLVWAACRFYYFLFYVLERYVDPALRYAGIWSLLSRLLSGRSHTKDDETR